MSSIASLIIIALIALSATLVFLDLGLKALDIRPLPIGMGALWELDDELGWRFRPGIEGWVTKPDDDVEVWVTINASGLRDSEYSSPPSQGTKRILILGDSFSAALEVELKETFHELLEEKLNGSANDLRYEVINTGVSGYGTAQELLYYRRLGKLFQPDLVLLAFVDNDVVDNSYLDPSRDAPVFIRDAAGDLQLRTASGQGPGIGQTIKTWLRQNTRLYPVTMSYIHRVFPSTLPQAGGQGEGTESRQPKEPSEINPILGLLQTPISAAYEQAWAITEDLVLATRDEARAEDACFAVIVVPSHYQVDRIWEEYLPEVLATNDYEWNRTAVSERLSKLLSMQGIPFLDLTPLFRERANSGGEDLYLLNDGHWNVDGHKLAAEAIYPWILDNKDSLLSGDCRSEL